jgi:hypothetical protein
MFAYNLTLLLNIMYYVVWFPNNLQIKNQITISIKTTYGPLVISTRERLFAGRKLGRTVHNTMGRSLPFLQSLHSQISEIQFLE